MAESALKIGRMFKKTFKAVLPIAGAVAGTAFLGVPIPLGGGGRKGGPPGTAVEVQTAPPVRMAGLFGGMNPLALLVLFTVIGFIALAAFGRR